MVVEVIDVSSRILDELGVTGMERFMYRAFIKQVVTLWKKGKMTFRIKKPPEWVTEKLKGKGISLRAYRDERGRVVASWVIVKDEKTLVKLYECAYGCNVTILERIVEELKKYDRLFIV